MEPNSKTPIQMNREEKRRYYKINRNDYLYGKTWREFNNPIPKKEPYLNEDKNGTDKTTRKYSRRAYIKARRIT